MYCVDRTGLHTDGPVLKQFRFCVSRLYVLTFSFRSDRHRILLLPDMDSLLSEIEAIVSTGTRVNLNYYIAEELDPEVVEEIYAWFKEEAASDSLAEALKALGDDYEEEEIRLVRIKFLCEVAN